MIPGLLNKVALVTGASSSIERAVAVAFAEEGAKVVIASRNEMSALETLHMVEERGSEGIFIKTDVSVAMDVENLVVQTLKTYGRLDCALNANRISDAEESLIDLYKPGFRRLTDAHSDGMSLPMKYELPAMFVRDGGTIINLSPAMTLTTGLTQAETVEFFDSQVRIYTLGPTLIENKLRANPLKAAYPDVYDYLRGSHLTGLPEQIAHTVIALCSGESPFVPRAALPVMRSFGVTEKS